MIRGLGKAIRIQIHDDLTARAMPRWAGIDVFRGVAVLLVVLHHINLRFVLSKVDVAGLLPLPVSRVAFWSGYYSVITFFVISGFLITSLSMRRWGELRRTSLREFYGLRIARIAPCLVALLMILATLHLLAVPEYRINSERSTLGSALLAALTFHVNWLEGHHGYLPGSWDVLWSLSVEELFYLLFPVACVLLRRDRWLLVPIALLIVIGPLVRVAVSAQEPWNEYAYLACTDGLAFGCLAALLRNWSAEGAAAWLPSRRLLLAGGLAAITLVVCLRRVAVAMGLVRSGLHITVLEAGTAAVLMSLATAPVGSSPMGWIRVMFASASSCLQEIGRRSYEIYLTHMFVVFGLMRFFQRRAPQWQALWAWYIVTLIISILLGFVVARWFSEPANRAIRRAWRFTGGGV